MSSAIDISKPIKVSYCIETWLRDEQIKLSTARVKDRIAPVYELRNEPVAVVCFGPSLNDTWEEIKNFKHVISCSGSHKFLVDHGIVPTHHCEVDPRAHKVQLIGTPQKETEYLIASACHPAVFDHLEGFNVKLWHVFESGDEGIRRLPRSEWAIMGGSSVGLRALTIARFLGFTELHVFGMDGSEGPSGKHAAAHPSQPKGHSLVEYEGRTFKSTPSMAEVARQTAHELNQMPDVTAKFYGDGLVQHMMKFYVPAPAIKGTPLIAFNKPDLISAEYIQLNEQLHRENLAYGVGGGKHAEMVLKLCASIKSTSVLDYGAGKGYLAKALPFPIWEYDPAVEGKRESPRPADLVVCTDALEHIEPEKILFVLDDLRRCMKQVGYFTIHTGPARKTLPDGRNTHLLQRNQKWWEKKLSKFFTIGKIFANGPVLTVIVGPKQFTKEKKP